MENYKNLEIKFFNHQGKKMGMKTEESCFTFFFPFNSCSYINNLVLMIVLLTAGKFLMETTQFRKISSVLQAMNLFN